ncbi:hypothetical protein HPG69_000746, partial [Diceros bicornis minor]
LWTDQPEEKSGRGPSHTCQPQRRSLSYDVIKEQDVQNSLKRWGNIYVEGDINRDVISMLRFGNSKTEDKPFELRPSLLVDMLT